MSSPVIQYTDRNQLRVERVYSDQQMQQDRVCNGKENIKRSIEAGVGIGCPHFIPFRMQQKQDVELVYKSSKPILNS